MRASIPSNWISEQVVLDMKSSSGQGSYPVTVIFPDGVACPCRGYRHHGHCRHATGIRGWLDAIIPPRHLPE